MPYPDLNACGIHYMHFSFHVAGGLVEIDAFWEARGLDRTRERLLFAGYSRHGKPHTVYLQWARSHEGCSDVYLGVDARKPSKVWPHRPIKAYRLGAKDFQDFVNLTRKMDVPFGIRARYAYPWDKEMESVPRPPHARLKNISFDILDEEQRPAVNLTYERQDSGWIALVEPMERFPLPNDKSFFSEPYNLGCLLAKTIRQEVGGE
jgi:hypothetical protein